MHHNMHHNGTRADFGNALGRSWMLGAVFVVGLMLLWSGQAWACGWWGDGEVNRGVQSIPETGPDGQPLEQSLSLQSAKLPGEMGYGIAMPDPGQAIPYLMTTFGRPVTDIAELKTYGFKAVIDVGTPDGEAARHRAETQSAGMVYHNIPVDGDVPTAAQVERFREMVLSSSSEGPLLVYASTAPLLGAMWTGYRLSFGAPETYALEEGRRLGLTAKQEEKVLGLFR